MSRYDVAIAYRIYPGSDDNHVTLDGWGKYELAAVCLRSLVDALSEVDYELYAILDDCPDRYRALFEAEIPDDRLEIREYPGIGNEATFDEQLRILSEEADAEAVLLAEDDYVYRSEGFEELLDVVHRPEVDFVTPYDHPDYYQTDTEPGKPDHLAGLHDYESDVLFEGRHWRTVSSTTCSFFTTPATLRETRPALDRYATLSDYGMWLCLTKKRRTHYNPLRTAQMYVHAAADLLFGDAYTLWSPMPSIATHLEEGYLAPGVEWEERIDEVREGE